MVAELNHPCDVIPLKYITEIEEQYAVSRTSSKMIDQQSSGDQNPAFALKPEEHLVFGEEAFKKHRIDVVHLLTHEGKALVLGSGRYATVVLGADRINYSQANAQFLAIKFLKQDMESDVSSKIARIRFYEEIQKTREIPAQGGAFVEYKGFSSYKLHTSEKYDSAAAESLRSRFGREYIQSIVKENQIVKEEVEKAVASNLQGEFYVMHAESGTLDDLLIYKQPWDSRGLESVRKNLAAVAGAPDPLGRFRKDRHDDLVDLARKLNLEEYIKDGQDFSGFAILKEIGEHKPKERNRMVIEIFREILRAIQTVHRLKLSDDEGYLAHRDIKPGNFLVRCGFPELTLLTSDLGFVSGSKNENLGANTMAVSTREPGVLAPGSYMFRAPEQFEQGYEVHFQVEAENSGTKNPMSRTISFDNTGDKNIEPKDWFESDAISAKSGQECGSTPFKCAIEGVEYRGKQVVLTLSNAFAFNPSQSLFHGYITRLSALHSDLFSLGCILYFLISGGKNPEKFYIKCLEPLPLGRQRSRNSGAALRIGKEADLYENCLSTSATLCAEEGGNIIKEIEKTIRNNGGKALYRGEDIEFVEDLVTQPNILGGIGKRKIQSLRNYREHLHNTGSVPYYLFDGNNRAIPFAILYHIVRLLMRDKNDSYVSRVEPGWHDVWPPDRKVTKSYFDISLHEKTKEVYDAMGTVLDLSLCCEKQVRDYANLGATRAEYFVMLRCCLHPKLFDEDGLNIRQLDGGAVEARPPSSIVSGSRASRPEVPIEQLVDKT